MHGLDRTGEARAARSRNLRLSGVLAAGLVTAALALSGCSGDDAPSKAVASIAPTGNQSTASAPAKGSDPAAYSRCMRQNGMADFPDPDADGNIQAAPGSAPIEPNSPEFQKAQKACSALAPSRGTAAERNALGQSQLKFSKCMRDNGLTNFPDPDADGNIQATPGTAGLDPDSAKFKKASEACKQYLQGGGPGSK